jgi:hypothetical protein
MRTTAISSRWVGLSSARWRKYAGFLLAIPLTFYCMAVLLDLPSPAETRYLENLPAGELARWGVTPIPSAQIADHWWDKAQGLRGWGLFPEGWSWPKLAAPPLTRWLPIVVMAMLGLIAFRYFEARVGRHPWRTPWLALAVLVAFSYGLQLGALELKNPSP